MALIAAMRCDTHRKSCTSRTLIASEEQKGSAGFGANQFATSLEYRDVIKGRCIRKLAFFPGYSMTRWNCFEYLLSLAEFTALHVGCNSFLAFHRCTVVVRCIYTRSCDTKHLTHVLYLLLNSSTGYYCMLDMGDRGTAMYLACIRCTLASGLLV